MSQISIESAAVQNYITVLQGIINRMASNSASCKNWCVALVSGILVIIANKGQPNFAWIAVIPIGLFLFLDAYYLGLEKRFIGQYNDFVEKVHSGAVSVEDVYIIESGGGGMKSLLRTLESYISIAVWPFYLLLTVMLLISRYWIIPRS